MKYDIIVVGSGPGGYVTAIRASQLGFKTAVVERENLGGICLNWGCIPTKALLKSASVYQYVKHAGDYGISAGEPGKDFGAVIARSREVASSMSKGIEFLMKKNKIDVIKGTARVLLGKKIEVADMDGKKAIYEADHIIIATGARSRELPCAPQDGKKIIGYREALSLSSQPASMLVIGSGAIGTELAFFYSAMGTQVTLVEFMPNIVPLEESEVSQTLEKSLKKEGINILTSSSVEKCEVKGDQLEVTVKTSKGEKTIVCDVVLSAVGIKSNIEGLGLEEAGIGVEKDKIKVDDFYRTNVEGYYAIGDVIATPALAHVASAEGITCVEKIKGMDTVKMDYNNIPSCIYTSPQVASVGMSEAKAKEAGYEVKVGKFPFSASGKAKASGVPEGFVKVVFDAKYGELLGCSMVGDNVTEMITEAVIARKLETTAHEILKAVHPHPTMSEAFMEAVAAACDEVIHL